jgi:thymidylate synthase
MNKLDEQYRGILGEVLHNGTKKGDRTGTGTYSIFGMQIRHKMSDGFPLLTTKKIAIKTMMTELKWFLKGDTNIKYLVNNNCNIWNGDAYKNFLKHNPPHDRLETLEEFINKIKTNDEFAEKWGELGPIYGKQWRSWNTKQFESLNDGNFGYKYNDVPIDQIQNLINELKTNPDSRRLMVSAWNVGELDQMTLPPCHYGFQVYTRELSAEERHPELYQKLAAKNYETVDIDKEIHLICDENKVPKRAISLMWQQRSVDTFLGLPFNIASYGLLLEIIAKEVNMIPDELIGNLRDTHLYLNHIEQAEEQLDRVPFELPKLKLSNVDILSGEFKAELVGYKHHPKIKASLSN